MSKYNLYNYKDQINDSLHSKMSQVELPKVVGCKGDLVDGIFLGHKGNASNPCRKEKADIFHGWSEYQKTQVPSLLIICNNDFTWIHNYIIIYFKHKWNP